MFISIRQRTKIRLSIALLPPSILLIAHYPNALMCGSPVFACAYASARVNTCTWLMWQSRWRLWQWWRLLLISHELETQFDFHFFFFRFFFGCGFVLLKFHYPMVVRLWESAVALKHLHCLCNEFTIGWRTVNSEHSGCAESVDKKKKNLK